MLRDETNRRIFSNVQPWLQYGHPLPFVLLVIEASHSCPDPHCHQTFCWLPDFKSVGLKFPFFVGCHSRAKSGRVVAREVNGVAFLPLQYGHPLPLLDAMVASHSWPTLHCHHAFWELPAVTSKAVSEPFFFECHSAASDGCVEAKQFEMSVVLLEQMGQPVPLTRCETVAFHSCPFSHCHQTRFPLLGGTSLGIRTPFLIGCHSLAILG